MTSLSDSALLSPTFSSVLPTYLSFVLSKAMTVSLLINQDRTSHIRKMDRTGYHHAKQVNCERQIPYFLSPVEAGENEKDDIKVERKLP